MARHPTREEAWTILTEHVKSSSLISHTLAVEAVMRHVARKRGADEELWGVIGLVHDVDYEEHPEEHLRHATEILRRHGWPEECVRAVASHGWGLFAAGVDTIEGMKTVAESIGLKGNPDVPPSA